MSVGQGGREANNASFDGYISDGGRYVAFVSDPSNLVPHDTNKTTDAFSHAPTMPAVDASAQGSADAP